MYCQSPSTVLYADYSHCSFTWQ